MSTLRHGYGHTADTSQIGNSGSPVLRQQDFVALGTHVYGGSLNSASVIGKYGNSYQDYIAAFSLPVPNDSMNLIPVTGTRQYQRPCRLDMGQASRIA